MSKAYNLRKKQKENNDNCYLHELLGSKHLRPKVCLERLKVLESSEDCRYYLHNGKIVALKSNNRQQYNRRNLLLIVISCILVLCIVYGKGFQNYNVTLKRRSTEMYAALQNFDAVQVLINNYEVLYNFIKAEQNKNINNFSSPKTNFNKDDCDVSKFVDSQVEEYRKTQKEVFFSPMDFIEEQCKIQAGQKSTEELDTDENGDFQSFGSLNLTDFALESQGAKIVSVFDTEPYSVLTMKFWEYDLGTIHNYFFQKYLNLNGPSSILVPWKRPGDCWAFKGSYGRVEIELSEKIAITGITIDHLNEDINITGINHSAPKKFKVVGIGEDQNKEFRTYLGSYEYKLPGPVMQTFLIKPKTEKLFKGVEVTFESNHGNKYTCVYKVRVHGHK